MEHTIDAKNKSLGRVATEAATFLMGKNKPSFRKNVVADVKVKVINASRIRILQKKLTNKEYATYSGYPGGLKKETLAHLTKRRGYGEAMRRAVSGMLPKNKLRTRMMKNLEVTE